MQSRALEMLVGSFVCLGVAAVFVLTFRVASPSTVSSGDGTYEVNAKFDTVGSLAAGASVKIAGVSIGRVKRIRIDRNTFQAIVTLDIDARENTIPEDSVAKILTAGLLGEQYVGIDPGGDDKPLKNGSDIKFTQSALVLENLIGQFLTSSMQKDSGSGNNSGTKGAAASQPAPPTK